MPPPTLTREEWQSARRRAFTRALQLTKSGPKAKELTDAATAKALEPDSPPWDPSRHATFAHYLCDLVWSAYGTEIASYRVTLASERLETVKAVPDLSAPNRDELLLEPEDEARAKRLYAALHEAVKEDALVVLLLQEDDEDPPDEDEHARPHPSAEPASTRRALAKGYTLADIKNARRRLKRWAEAVARKDSEKNEVKS